MRPLAARALALVAGLAMARLVTPWWCGRDEAVWYDGDAAIQRRLADELVADRQRAAARAADLGPGDGVVSRWIWRHRGLVLGLAVYAIARLLLVRAIGDGGVLTPEHTVERWRAGAVFALLVMRLTILIAVPLAIGYRATAYFIPWITTRLRAR